MKSEINKPLKVRPVMWCLAILLLCFLGLSVRLACISTSEYAEAATANNTRSVRIAQKRATIYDCNMKPLTDKRILYRAAVVMVPEAVAALHSVFDTQELKKITERFSPAAPVIVDLGEKGIASSKGITVLAVTERYEPSVLAPHIIGYLNSLGHGVCGVEKAYDEYLSENGGTLCLSYSADAKGTLLTGEKPEIRDDGYYGNQGLVLTIDSDIQKIAYDALSETVDVGAAVVLENATGKIRALVSLPQYLPRFPELSLKSEDSPFLNRAFTAYAVGSVFKVITATAIIENNIDQEYYCTGSVTVGANTFHCNANAVHGELDLCGALENSCNCYFIEKGLELTGKVILESAMRYGLGSAVSFGDTLEAEGGTLPALGDLNVRAAAANFAFGQGEFTATPLQMAQAFAAIAERGVYNSASLIEGSCDENGVLTEKETFTSSERIISQETADLLQKYLISVVENGGGKRAKPESGGAGGKTASAQSGIYENGEEVIRCWFAGFFPENNPEYTVVIFKESGTSGAKDCAPVFKKISDGINNKILEKE